MFVSRFLPAIRSLLLPLGCFSLSYLVQVTCFSVPGPDLFEDSSNALFALVFLASFGNASRDLSFCSAPGLYVRRVLHAIRLSSCCQLVFFWAEIRAIRYLFLLLASTLLECLMQLAWSITAGLAAYHVSCNSLVFLSPASTSRTPPEIY